MIVALKCACDLNLVVNLVTRIWLSWLLIMTCQHRSKLDVVVHGSRLAKVAKMGWWSGMDQQRQELAHTGSQVHVILVIENLRAWKLGLTTSHGFPIPKSRV
jgi:hypothetical protein